VSTLPTVVPEQALPRRFNGLAAPDGMPLLLVHGDARFLGDRFLAGDLVPIPLRDVLWRWLRAQGWTRVVFHSMEQTLFTLDAAKAGAEGPATAEAGQPAGPGAGRVPRHQARIRGPFGTRVLLPGMEAPGVVRGTVGLRDDPQQQAGLPLPEAPVGRAARPLNDLAVVDLCVAWMRAGDARTAVVFLETENWLAHGRAQRAFAEALSQWLGPDAVPGNLCVLVVARRTVDEVRELVERLPAFPGLLAAVESLQQDPGDAGAPGRFAVGPPDVAEIERLVHAHRLRNGLRVDFARLDATLRVMTAARRPVRDWITRLGRLAPQPSTAGMLSPGALLEHGWNPDGSGGERSAADRLAGMVGLAEVKKHVERVRRSVEFAQERAQAGHPVDANRLNLVFSGNPGTGKSTVAEFLGEIYRDIGALPIGHVHVVEPSGLVGSYQGWTQRAVETAFEEARGGVLFIDEAYQLSDAARDGSFQQQALTAIVRLMERDRGQLAVVVAGYPDKMREFLRSDPGLPRRFPEQNRITFPDYSPAELLEILLGALHRSGLTVDDATRETLATVIIRIHAQRGRTFGNAGEMEELAREMTTRWLERVGERRDLPVTAEDLPERHVGPMPSDGGSPDQALGELDRFVGLTSVKRQVEGMVARLRHEMKMHRLGIHPRPDAQPVNHMLFVGPPGTGKTTVARLLGTVLHDLGLLAGGQVVEVTRTDLVARHLGNTGPQVREVIDRAMGGILFVDEAYNLIAARDDLYGREATNTLLEEMERRRGRFVVVAAGYPDLIDRWIATNDGLQSRFPLRLEFPPFATGELVEVLRRAAADDGYLLPETVAPRAADWFDQARRRAGPRFGNAREARSLLDIMITQLAGRTANATNPAELTTLAPEDVPDAGR